jgi:hypothetical protein
MTSRRACHLAENEARTMRVAGRLYLSMTWPDDPTIPVDWIFDHIYDKGSPGPNKAKDIDWFELWTTENRNLNQQAVANQMAQWDETTKAVRIKGQPIRFSNRIHPLFTDIPLVWSYQAGKVIVPENGKCPETGSPTSPSSAMCRTLSLPCAGRRFSCSIRTRASRTWAFGRRFCPMMTSR